jgi:hypothetical protein
MPTAFLADRAVIHVSGPDAEHLLQNIITTDLDALGRGEAKPGALLTPQGKILFDFLVSRHGEDGFLLDCRNDAAGDLVRRLTMYRLRAKVQIAVLDQSLVEVRWQPESTASAIGSASSSAESSADAGGESDQWLADRRFGGGVSRRAVAGDRAEAGDLEGWHALRIARGVAESGADFGSSEVFPHDVLLDRNGGVGLRKGCYVGQEVVSRMQHRGTARRRIVVATAEGVPPEAGTDITISGRSIGTLGSSSGSRAIAIVRLDKAKAAMDAGDAIEAGGVALTLEIPPWSGLDWPASPSAEDA